MCPFLSLSGGIRCRKPPVLFLALCREDWVLRGTRNLFGIPERDGENAAYDCFFLLVILCFLLLSIYVFLYQSYICSIHFFPLHDHKTQQFIAEQGTRNGTAGRVRAGPWRAGEPPQESQLPAIKFPSFVIPCVTAVKREGTERLI